MKTNNLYAQLSVGQGPVGPVGPQGPKGDKGDKGETGAVGPQGPKGDKGERGARGPQGNQGATGKQGPQGPAGLRGEKGDKGDRGPQGIQGIQGPKGDKGDTGAQGPKGDRGEKGEKGDSGGVMPADMVDYMGNQHESLKAKNDADVDWLLGEVNTVHYDGQHITATDTIEGRSKSAILSGQTLVNLFQDMDYVWNKLTKQDSFNYNGDLIILNNGYHDGRYWKTVPKIPNIKSNTEYTMIFTKGSSPYVDIAGIDENDNTIMFERFTNAQKVKITSPNNGDLRVKFSVNNPSSEESPINLGKVMLIEGDYTNVDIPYFEGMQSVKAPVLESVGKNLINMNNFHSYYNGEILSCNANSITFNAPNVWAGVFVNLSLKPNTEYHISYECQNDNTIKTIIRYLNDDETLTGETEGGENNFSFMTKGNGKVRVSIESNKVQDNIVLKNIQIEEGSTATSYEPYKSNILTTPEDLELRGIGDVQDTLDLLTGELTQRVGEVVLDGSQSFILTGTPNQVDTLCILFPNFPKIANGAIMSDKLITESNYDYSDFECITQNTHGIAIRLLRNKLESVDKNGVEKFLSQNPITVQYQLATESVKTVDLSDNHVYSYENTTHYDCSSAEGSLVPTLSLDVPTKLNALVARQKDTIQELTQENESLKAAQQILLNSQLSFYETLVSAIPALMPVEGGQAIIPDFIQDLYRLENNQK